MQQDSRGLFQAFDENRSVLLRFVAARIGDPSEAEDLLQDVWIKLSSGSQSGPIDAPLSYLFKICENAVRDAKRSEKRKLARETLWTELGSDSGYEKSETATPERIAIERDYLLNVLAELDTLPERTRQVFLDFRVNGITQKEIASSFGISISAVEKHLQRAYRLMLDFRKKMMRDSDERGV